MTSSYMQHLSFAPLIPDGIFYRQALERLDDSTCLRAGTAVLLNNSNVHAGTVRQTALRRVSLRVDYGHIEHSMGGRRYTSLTLQNRTTVAPQGCR